MDPTLFELAPQEFEGVIAELGLPQSEADQLRRQYRRQNSMFAGLYGLLDSVAGRDAEQGRVRADMLPMTRPEGMTGIEALLSGNAEFAIPGGLLGGAEAAAMGIDAPAAAYQGMIPAEDMVGEALGTGGMAMLGGGAVARPASSVGMGGRVVASSDFGQGWDDVYHWTRSEQPFSQFDPNRSTSAMSQLGPHVGTLEAAQARAFGFPNETGQMIPLRADLRRPFMDPQTNQPWSEMDLEVFLSAMADEHGVDRREIAPIMRGLLAREGYTDIPYVNDVEDAGSISNIMLVDRPTGYDAVLRRQDAAFDPARRTDPNLLAANRSPTAGAVGLLANESRAQRIARMLREGRGDEITDDMLAALDANDNMELAQLYAAGETGVDMPMDFESRMARAREMGRTSDQYHATNADFPAFIASQTGLTGRGIYTGDSAPDVFDYARARQDGIDGLNIIPLVTPDSSNYARRIDWQNVLDADPDLPYNATWQQEIEGFQRAAENMSGQGFLGVHSQPGERVTFEPRNVRSRFARFDPRLSHLENLNAANASLELGLLAASAPSEEDQLDQLRAYLGLLNQ